jgi:ubiquinone/menaquinone biosynthesis C-methylase UbiE
MIKKYYQFITESALLKLKDNVDMDMISKIQSVIKPPSKILEISCGNGADSLYLKNLGYEVTSTEINDDYVNNALKLGIKCIKHDTKNDLPFKDNEFDLVYSRLGIHYFTKPELSKIFSEIRRVSNQLLFSVKLVDDISTGKIILSEDDWIQLTEDKFTISNTEIKNGILYGSQTNWIEILAIGK